MVLHYDPQGAGLHYGLLLITGLAAATATMAGGLFAARLRVGQSLFRAFSCGVVIGVALFELLPEATELGAGHYRPFTLMATSGLGFALYLLADRMLGGTGSSGLLRRGHMAPASLTLHSLMDGLAIGLAFKVSPEAGVVITLSVLTHDLLDGVNTVTLALAGGAKPRTALRWLVADALAPLVGMALSLLIVAPPGHLSLLLALFAGFFLFIGMSEVVLHRDAPARPPLRIVLATLAGLLAIGVVARLGDLVTLFLTG